MPYEDKVITQKVLLSKTESTSDPLRERDDFKKLLDSLDDSVHIG